LDLELHRNFTISKAEGWDSVSKAIVAEACDAKRGASAWAVVMSEGVANIAVLLGDRTVLRQRINTPIPGKKGVGQAHDRAMERFFQTVLETLLRHIDLSENLPLLLASPAYTASNFLKYVMDTATRTANKALLSQKPNFVVVHSSTGQYHSLGEVLKDPTVAARLKDTRYARETKLVDTFFDLMRKDEGKAWYGPREVEKAVDAGAVGRGGGVLLISNSLFRSLDVGVRKRWVALVDRVRDIEGGEVRVLSSEHESGRRLEGLGGIAAILTYPIFDLDEDQEDESV
jgi:protein pelota